MIKLGYYFLQFLQCWKLLGNIWVPLHSILFQQVLVRERLQQSFCECGCVATRSCNTSSVSPCWFTIRAFCSQLQRVLLQAHPQFTLLFSWSLPICRHFNCLTLADLTLLPGRHSATLNDYKRGVEDEREGVGGAVRFVKGKKEG